MCFQRGSALPIIIILVMIIGVVVGTSLVNLPQIFRSKASEESISPLYASVQCNQNGQATFTWNEIPEAAEYIVNVPRTANTPQAGVEAGRKTSATIQMQPGAEYPDWELKVGLKTGGYRTFDQKDFRCDGSTSGQIPAELFVYPVSASVTCNVNGQANFLWSSYPEALSYQLKIYPASGSPVTFDAGQSTSVSAPLQPDGVYQDWELIVSLANDTKVFDQLDFRCDGTVRGEVPASTPTPTTTLSAPTPTPTPQPAVSCNSACSSVGVSQGEYVCVSDSGERRWRLANCTGNGNCNCTSTIF